ncbi:ATP-binding protein [Pseudoprevotella muciniphila]|uniref:ATP-binding protein n=1 Tax=Pseudoprevotella muciniphila TaxID=2133944 RepID=A0A5P8E8A4_9BACT|nr:ATP-binding protein [Pseudoprevotella muciniphila]QFQ13120.1 ATP-binding protein [Pseudoprevotella muciniphila]
MYYFQRQKYLDKLVESQGNGLVKIVTGGRRCGKSFLLFDIFHRYLTEHDVDENHIVELSLDDRTNRRLRNPDVLLDYIENRTPADGHTYYVVLDEVQLVDDFVEVLLSLMHKRHLDVYVSGSNSKFLSKDVVTEFRGRGDEIRVWPLSFKEYYEVVGGDRTTAWNDYYTFGGLPQVVQFESATKKIEYLINLYELTYLHDVIERNHLRNPEGLRQLTQILASAVGTSTNPKRICNTFQSVEGKTIISKTIKDYIGHLQDAFLIEEAMRYDVKGRKYIGTETKYYFTDIGLRAAALNYRQQEETHIMENIIYNELRSRGYRVDVGLVETWERDDQGKAVRKRLEVDFVVNQGPDRVYLQSAFRMPTSEKENQEQRPLLGINDSFRKMIVVGDNIMRKINDKGIVTMGLLDFLLDTKSISSLFEK